jgi:hypothetical protein
MIPDSADWSIRVLLDSHLFPHILQIWVVETFATHPIIGQNKFAKIAPINPLCF